MQVRDADSVRYLAFDRPDTRNAFTADVARDLAAELEDLDPGTLDAVVLTGAGEAFSAGGDVEAMAERDETTAEAYERIRETLGRVAERVLTAPVPIVAKVDGDAVGAGLSLVAAADFAYAAESARFGASFINVGLVPDMGATVTLPRLVGLRTAKALALTGKLIDARTADELDLVNETVPDGDLDARIDEILETLAACPTENVGLAKRAIHDNLGRPWSDGLEREASVQSLAYDTPAHEEGVDAFLTDRSPEFE
ncbi:enoyl-CoA hydratase/isomerase family protein [Natronobacterium gregoryi]|uniref:Enoyl-CoA hydratase n=2 Tax=Natronobacterium gregoryi TaxID=44930 RepID=L0AEW4_NATGS|nr:enoyl-CoA hydratase/isomerase family protein [Natronobacterium gregoryi]AFZ72458.1 enoyl-CoA hydratase/carnithine racemase [Natronobacterium gregoryi SP2]ELY74328.1 enoyl-CoA hydratase [Natronobacterium gregoryi SP2]PLK21430.1 enoyl-CoA hydratase/isomerase family protein [Natronobacterium gregoryi SP2]SFI78053.1 Enoyl-CoA hydratase [Natronobacterium gregoryi]